jgi:hypothetical protein
MQNGLRVNAWMLQAMEVRRETPRSDVGRFLCARASAFGRFLPFHG